MTTTLNLGSREVGPGSPVFIIAEAGVNHNGSVKHALALVDAARAAGADAVKFQLYNVAEQVSEAAGTAGYQHAQTGSTNMLDMARSYDLPWSEHFAIAKHCRSLGILYMASCFDSGAVDFLVELGGNCVKVGSGEITNYPLLRHIARTELPIILSTGMSTEDDVARAIAEIRDSGSSDICLLQCTSNYPTPPHFVNLRAMTGMAETFHLPVGFSDHTAGNTAAIAAVALGACVLEKHFTIDKSWAGPDHAMSLTPAELTSYVSDIRDAEAMMGDPEKRPVSSEIDMMAIARRSLCAARDITAGTPLSDDDVTFKRPGTGIDPRDWKDVRGRVASTDLKRDTPITWAMLD